MFRLNPDSSHLHVDAQSLSDQYFEEARGNTRVEHRLELRVGHVLRQASEHIGRILDQLDIRRFTWLSLFALIAASRRM